MEMKQKLTTTTASLSERKLGMFMNDSRAASFIKGVGGDDESSLEFPSLSSFPLRSSEIGMLRAALSATAEGL